MRCRKIPHDGRLANRGQNENKRDFIIRVEDVWPANQLTFPYAPVSLLILGSFSANRTETTATATSDKGEFQTRIYSFSIQLGAVHTCPFNEFFCRRRRIWLYLDHSFTRSASYEVRA
jgi:hypothetical protein